VSPEACCASYKYEINFDTLLYLVGFSLWIGKWSLAEELSGARMVWN
jgi:hypothetical protein